MSIVENYTTKIAASRTCGEIQDLLARHGANQVVLNYTEGRLTGVAFSAQTEFGERAFRLPVDVDAMHLLLVSEKRAGRLPGLPTPQAQDKAQAERVAWRVIKEWLASQMTLVAARMASLDQVMLPYLVLDGREVYTAYREQQQLTLTQGGQS